MGKGNKTGRVWRYNEKNTGFDFGRDDERV